MDCLSPEQIRQSFLQFTRQPIKWIFRQRLNLSQLFPKTLNAQPGHGQKPAPTIVFKHQPVFTLFRLEGMMRG
jgi:hypothetical protein